MTPEWSVSIDGTDYHPIPPGWINAGVDEGLGHPRLYAVSAAVVANGGGLRVRYAHPRSVNVLSVICKAVEHPDGAGHVPEGVVERDEEWERSIVPHAESPKDVLRSVESRHLRTLWGSRVSEVPTDEEMRRVLADGSGVIRGCFDA